MEILANGSVTSPRGFSAGATYCGLKTGGLDLCIVYSEHPCTAAGVFTRNRVQAAPIAVCREHLRRGRVQGFVANSGNANACTGEPGVANAREMAALAAARVGLEQDQMLVASTGVIGVPLDMDKVRRGLQSIQLSPEGGHEAARAIITTDTTTKEIAVSLDMEGCTITIGGMCKGSGMIHPNMGTMLAFLTTDAAAEPAFLQEALHQAVDATFNMVTVDGDTSTNDTAVVLANGAAANPVLSADSPSARAFQEALTSVCQYLAIAIARDGEGASKLLTVTVRGAESLSDARLAARTVAGSSLFKAAVYGADPNWGRILAAAGRSGAMVDQTKADIWIGDVALMQGGRILPFDRQQAAANMKGAEVNVLVDLHLGTAEATAWGCDLTERYVEINAEYTT